MPRALLQAACLALALSLTNQHFWCVPPQERMYHDDRYGRSTEP